jgi:SAM-dependent methyltransferase
MTGIVAPTPLGVFHGNRTLDRQRLENKRGEVSFRRRLYEQQVLGEPVLDQEMSGDEIESVLRDRMAQTLIDIGGLRDAGVVVTPFVELGAERGQRALALENRRGWSGAAVDLSLDLLASCEHYGRRFDHSTLPLRICADAYRLPFASGSVPFVFCYQTLHHFPDPRPIVREVHRILMPGGRFFFSEEPVRRRLRFGLYTLRRGSRPDPTRGAILRVVDRLFARVVVTEEEFGVIENHDMGLEEWRRALTPFQQVHLTLRTARVLRMDPDRTWHFPGRLVATLLGGVLSGLCRKAGSLDPTAIRAIESTLISPRDLARGVETPIGTEGRSLSGLEPDDRYPVHRGVAVLLEPALREALYPELDG